MKKPQTTTMQIGSAILGLINIACKRGDGVIVRSNGETVGIISVVSGKLIDVDGITHDSSRCRIYRATVPQLRLLASLPARTLVRYSDAVLIVELDQLAGGLWRYQCRTPRLVTIGHADDHDTALDKAYNA